MLNSNDLRPLPDGRGLILHQLGATRRHGQRLRRDREGQTAREAAVSGAASRVRPIVMTSCAMLAGMIPMALSLGESGQQSALLGRAVIDSLLAATCATLLVLPAVFALLQSRASRASGSLDPTDPASAHYAASEEMA